MTIKLLEFVRELLAGDDEEKRPKTTVQTLIFSKDHFEEAKDAKAWCEEHDYKASKVDETEESFRMRQREPGDFVEGSFRTIELIKGVKAVVGHLKGKASKMAAGDEDLEVEVARSGEFKAMGGKRIKITPDVLREMVETFDLSEHRPKNKIGHPEQEKTDTPAHGSVTALRYDEKKDRLLAKVKPSAELRQWIKDGKYTERSIEFHPQGKNGKARFLHLGWLGASDPAISGLAPVPALASDPAAVVVFAMGPEAEPDSKAKTGGLDTRETVAREEPKGEKNMPDKDEAEKQKEALAKAENENKAMRERLVRLAKSDVTTFLASDALVKRVPLKVRKDGRLERLLVELATMDAQGTGVVKLAGEDGKETESSLYELAKGFLSAMPEQLSPDDTRETAKTGPDGEDASDLPAINAARLAGPDPEGDAYYRLANEEITSAKSHGETIDFREAARRAYQKKGARA